MCSLLRVHNCFPQPGDPQIKKNKIKIIKINSFKTIKLIKNPPPKKIKWIETSMVDLPVN